MTMNFQPDSVQTMIVEAVDEVAPKSGIVGVAPVSCGAFIYDGFDFDFCQSVPGCAPAVASGIKRVRPNALVFTYQNSIDLAAAGISEVLHAANRGENISVIYANSDNSETNSSEESRIKICELLSGINNPVYITRVVATEKDNKAAIKAIKNAFKLQLENKGFSFIEILTVVGDEESKEVKDLLAEFPPKVFVDKCGVEKA
ncbi:MAG: MFS transporter [Candidatus Riflebacteria bacterium]|nr:MFS transporter [Candidatus Riflebacteria bacterium]